MKPTKFFGINLWITILKCIALVVLMTFSIASYFVRYCRQPQRRYCPSRKKSSNGRMDRIVSRAFRGVQTSSIAMPRQFVYFDKGGASTSGASKRIRKDSDVGLLGLDMMPCKTYTLEEIDEATGGFATHNIIGSGEYGVVYHGILSDETQVAVKKLLINRGTLGEFTEEVEAMRRIRHKNLVKLLGFCAEGTFRLLVYEFVDNGNLKQWLHLGAWKVSPLSWNSRMKIVEGIAKGLAYLHNDFEPSILHKHIKSSNILLDNDWNPKLSDARISSFIGPVWSYCTAPPMGMSGYTAPEYGKRGGVHYESDVYSFGVLLMEIVSGKTSVDKSVVTEIEESLVDWINYMVSLEKLEEIVDPRLPETPPIKEVRRILAIACKCVDSDDSNRPSMCKVIRMLQQRDMFLDNVRERTSRIIRML